MDPTERVVVRLRALVVINSEQTLLRHKVGVSITEDVARIRQVHRPDDRGRLRIAVVQLHIETREVLTSSQIQHYFESEK